jgi:hypothetical protein
VHRVWQEAGMRPHRLEPYMASNDPDLETRAANVIGLYLNPPQHAAVFFVDEESAYSGAGSPRPAVAAESRTRRAERL